MAKPHSIDGEHAIIHPMAENLLTLTLPGALAREFETLQQDFLLELLERGLREIKIDRALELYAGGGLSFGAAAERAGITQSEMARHAYARGLEPSFSSATLAEELG
jgi:predicted HTH domain antitoxin